ncbi:hypothetical protein EJ110_NYTH09728 [Nymphaea thermarum]|nr:hypothetical protein EJ110_NYTH09728 [Nymphaea thermarum]
MALRQVYRSSLGWGSLGRLLLPTSSSSMNRISLFCSSVGAGPSETVTLQMIDYAFSHARSQRSDGSYSDALLVLEQGLSNLQRTDKSCENSIGKILLAMSALHSERGDLATALDKAQLVHGLPFASLALREKCLQLLSEGSGADSLENEALQLRAKALKGLVDLVLGTPESGRVALSYAEYLHATGNLFLAKEYYQKALLISPTNGLAETSVLGALGMDEVHLSANCALGQVATHTGKFKEAEEVLTGALKEVEEHFGSNHPKVGMVLTCMADMFRQKGTLDGSSTLLIQEGLYRRAIDLMKAPSLDVEAINPRCEKWPLFLYIGVSSGCSLRL